MFRPDVQCTNGYIHVIDYPLVEESDVNVARGSWYSSAGQSHYIASSVLLLPAAFVLASRLWF